MGELREKIPKVKPGQKTKFQDDLVMLNELLQVRTVPSILNRKLIDLLTPEVVPNIYSVLSVIYNRLNILHLVTV